MAARRPAVGGPPRTLHPRRADLLSSLHPSPSPPPHLLRSYLEEVSSCNLFVVKGKTIRTPPLQARRDRSLLPLRGVRSCAAALLLLLRCGPAALLVTCCSRLTAAPSTISLAPRRAPSCRASRGARSSSWPGRGATPSRSRPCRSTRRWTPTRCVDAGAASWRCRCCR